VKFLGFDSHFNDWIIKIHFWINLRIIYSENMARARIKEWNVFVTLFSVICLQVYSLDLSKYYLCLF